MDLLFVFATRFFDVFSASKQNPFVFFFAIVPRHFVIGKSPEGKQRLAWNPGKRSRISHLSEKEVHNGIRTLIRDYHFVKSSSGFLDLQKKREDFKAIPFHITLLMLLRNMIGSHFLCRRSPLFIASDILRFAKASLSRSS